MLKLILDYNIFEDFINSQPKPIPFGSEKENENWLSFWTFLKNGGDVELINIKKDCSSIFITQLTTGREGTSISYNEEFKKLYKYTLQKDISVNSIFFLNELNPVSQELYRKKNSLAFGFISDYKSIWEKLSLLKEESEMSVRNVDGGFSNWSKLEDYIVALSDVIIVDNYILNDHSIIEPNLIEIIKTLQQKASKKFNLTIVTFEGNKYKMNLQSEFTFLAEKFKLNSIDCNLSIVMATYKLKEHDRGIFTNYLRIKSGDSFNYFNNKGEYITKGTDIDFYTLVNKNKAKVTLDALYSIFRIIQDSPINNKIGDFKNKLFECLE